MSKDEESSADFEWEVWHELWVTRFDGSVESISKALELPVPHRSGIAGELHVSGKRVNEISYWCFESRRLKGDTQWWNSDARFEDLNAMLGHLDSNSKALRQLMESCEVSVQTVVMADSPFGGFPLSAELINKLASHKLSWNLAFYGCPLDLSGPDDPYNKAGRSF